MTTLHEYDTVEHLPCGSVIQHGPNNNRIYLMRPGEQCPDELPRTLIEMAQERGYTKIFAKVPVQKIESFLLAGYYAEAIVPGFYNGRETGVFLAYCKDRVRKSETNEEKNLQNTELAVEHKGCACAEALPQGLRIRACQKTDAEEMAGIYQSVFPSYPFPIHDPEFIKDSMDENVSYFCAEDEEGIAALSSIEADALCSNAELTDFATLPRWRGKGLGTLLLCTMEKELKKRGIATAYTIARAASAGMNIVFARQGYRYAGRLCNNTHISGQIESMNVWYKNMRV